MSQLRSPLLGYAAVVSLAASPSPPVARTRAAAPLAATPRVGRSSSARTPSRCARTCPTSRSSSRTARQGRRLRHGPRADLAPRAGRRGQEVVDIEFASHTSGAAFAAKKCDMAMGAVDHQRQAEAVRRLLGPVLHATQALLVKKDSGITDLVGLKGKKLGVQTDTTGQAFAEKNKDANGYETVVFDDLPTEIAGVQSGRVDGAINDNGPLLDFAKDQPGLRGRQGVRHRRAVRLPLPEGRCQRRQDQGRLQRGPQEVDPGRLLQGQLQEVVRLGPGSDAERS